MTCKELIKAIHFRREPDAWKIHSNSLWANCPVFLLSCMTEFLLSPSNNTNKSDLGNRTLQDSLPVTNSTLRATEMCSMLCPWAQGMCNPGGIQKAWGKANAQTEDNDVIRGKCARRDVQAFSKAVRSKHWEPLKCFAAHLTKRKKPLPCHFTHRKTTWCWVLAEMCILPFTFSS